MQIKALTLEGDDFKEGLLLRAGHLSFLGNEEDPDALLNPQEELAFMGSDVQGG